MVSIILDKHKNNITIRHIINNNIYYKIDLHKKTTGGSLGRKK